MPLFAIAGAPLTQGYSGNSARVAAFAGFAAGKSTGGLSSNWLAVLGHRAIEGASWQSRTEQTGLPLHDTLRGPRDRLWRMMNLMVQAIEGSESL